MNMLIRHRGRRSRQGAFTLIELMIVIALVAVLLALAAPSMREVIEVRRLRAINAQLVTDLHFARSEAISRRAIARVTFNFSNTMSCYVVYTAPNSTVRCDCMRGPGNACFGEVGAVEIRTVEVPKTTGTSITLPVNQGRSLGFEPAMGSLVRLPIDRDPEPMAAYAINTSINTSKSLRVALTQSGRPSVCGPTGSTMGVGICP